MVSAECPIGTVLLGHVSTAVTGPLVFRVLQLLQCPIRMQVHILMQIKDHCNISYLVLAGFSSETTDVMLPPRQARKE